MNLGISKNTPNVNDIGFIKRFRSRRNYVQSKVFEKLNFKEIELKSEKTRNAIDWLGKHISTPENRFILGASALLSQPFIDLSNKKIDEDTRKTSAARTIAKIIVGTTTGVIIRHSCIKLIEQMCKTSSKNGKPLSKFSQFLVPKNIDSSMLESHNFKQYKNVIGSIVALVVMLFTNFLVDMPLTKWLTNRLITKLENDKQKEVR